MVIIKFYTNFFNTRKSFTSAQDSTNLTGVSIDKILWGSPIEFKWRWDV